MTAFAEWLQETFGLSPVMQDRLAASLIAIIAIWLLRRIILFVVWRRVEDVRTRYRWQKITAYTLVPIGILLVGRIWFEGFQAIGTFLGLLSAGIAIALRDPIVNLAGWGFLVWRRPFEVGDRVQIGDRAGDVIDIRIFQFTLLEIGNWVNADQSTGRVIHVPNGDVFTQTLANYSKGFRYIWNELSIVVTFESDWEKAKGLLEEINRRHGEDAIESAQRHIQDVSRRFLIHYRKLTPTVYTSVVDIGVCLTIRYLCEPRGRRGSAEEIWEDVLKTFAQHDDIDFAYPTQRFYDNRLEGKSGARAPTDPPLLGNRGGYRT